MVPREPIALQRHRSVLALIVTDVTNDLDPENLVGTPEHLVNRLSMLARGDLEADRPSAMRCPGELLGDQQLASIAEGCTSARIGADDKIETDRIAQ